jgi:hypothetical protein
MGEILHTLPPPGYSGYNGYKPPIGARLKSELTD